MFVLRATIHTTTQVTPMQLVFGRDALLNTRFIADWTYLKLNKENLIWLNNEKENKTHLAHTYKVGNKGLFKNKIVWKFGQSPYDRPHIIHEVWINGTVVIKRNLIIEPVNIRNIKPYRQ